MKQFIVLTFNINNFGNFIIKWSYNGSLFIYKNYKNKSHAQNMIK